MYRCLDCKAVFENRPNYCDCGNDTFEEFHQSAAPQYNNMNTSSIKPTVKKTYDFKEILSYSIFAICIILSIFAWIFIGKDASKPKSQDAPQQEANSVVASNIPDINTIWDNTIPTYKQQNEMPSEQSGPKQLLNKKMQSLSSEMTTYVITIGQTFVSVWPRGSVVGDGSCEVEFSINKDGKIIDKKIIKASKNKTLDDSISIMLENVTQTPTKPPADYQGENIIMAFSILHKEFKVYYPHY